MSLIICRQELQKLIYIMDILIFLNFIIFEKKSITGENIFPFIMKKDEFKMI